MVWGSLAIPRSGQEETRQALLGARETTAEKKVKGTKTEQFDSDMKLAIDAITTQGSDLELVAAGLAKKYNKSPMAIIKLLMEHQMMAGR